MGVDPISGGSLDVSRTVSGTSPFDIDILVRLAGAAYQGYQAALSFNTSVVNADTVTQLAPGGMTTCGATAIDNTAGTAYDFGCAKTSAGGITYTGPVTTVTLHCVGNGTSALHLITTVEDSDYGTTTLDAVGGFISTGLTDSQVTCQDVTTQNPAILARWIARLWNIMTTQWGALP
jgi:hypothetical protein